MHLNFESLSNIHRPLLSAPCGSEACRVLDPLEYYLLNPFNDLLLTAPFYGGGPSG